MPITSKSPSGDYGMHVAYVQAEAREAGRREEREACAKIAVAATREEAEACIRDIQQAGGSEPWCSKEAVIKTIRGRGT